MDNQLKSLDTQRTTKVGYVFVIRDHSEIGLVLEREVIKANLSEGATDRGDMTLHATVKVFRIYISCRREE